MNRGRYTPGIERTCVLMDAEARMGVEEDESQHLLENGNAPKTDLPWLVFQHVLHQIS
jgi:hypothetical protein